jgi:hypothetical protein
MLRTRGGGRFEGYGNVAVGGEGTIRGWQLTCSGCNAKSSVIYRRGPSFPPKILYQMFREKYWKLNGDPGADMCPLCVEKKRERGKEERKLYVKGSVDRLLDLIRQLDLMLASNVTMEYGPYQPQIAAQLKSLFETAYLCNMFPKGLLGEFNGFFKEADDPDPVLPNVSNVDTPPAPTPAPPLLEQFLEPDCQMLVPTGEQPQYEWQHGSHIDSMPTQRQREPEPFAPAPAPSSEPERRRMNQRTAAMLAEMRKAIFKDTHNGS